MANLWNYFLSEESGQGMVEYGLIIALIAVVLIGVLTAMGGGLKGTFQTITDKLGGAGNP
ncbi:pilus assembly protein Flp/PilA [Sporobacter termitidis DSM 10068]|uniref:Pilus assembly protein Flp/PilA n=1 Tax=Sporobacter termitidis DSM 10068 TaxID=1123282 RepID=A0A1M5Z477_9FIRM|nr:Flp family type IVb pilin [Sporobacter termitidis]SHI18981.1 pilus assembly protein Flp/PilA [Sporobacter termitidis DSM 10068]